MRERTEGRGLATRAIHAGERPDPTTHAHRTPIYATATFTFDSAAEKEEAVDRSLAWEPGAYFYSRTGNPTNRALEEKLASLEGAEDAVVSSSGMAAVAATLFAHLTAGDHLVAGDELFAITNVLLDEDFPRRGIDVTTGGPDRPRLRSRRRSRRTPARCSSRPRRTRGCASPTSTRWRPSRTATICCSSPTTRSSARSCCGPSSTAPTWSSTPRRSTCPVTATPCRGRRGSQGPDGPDPQADRHARPGRQPVLELPGPARRPDPAAAVAGGLGQCRPDRRLPRGPRQGRLGALSGPRLAPGPRRRAPAARRPGRRDGHVQAASAGSRRWPPSPTTCACATSG